MSTCRAVLQIAMLPKPFLACASAHPQAKHKLVFMAQAQSLYTITQQSNTCRSADKRMASAARILQAKPVKPSMHASCLACHAKVGEKYRLRQSPQIHGSFAATHARKNSGHRVCCRCATSPGGGAFAGPGPVA
eukprot:TRINITY_DN32299_c0_g1_i1.p3 TRINITY_DN32299_c0_g1~~TRINITY_DN32299_c0_g1_i1.p3  ORF type:complete len:134 (+),score=2.05 TRINITY_DN32299_c0_g1_i1:167-568(+)